MSERVRVLIADDHATTRLGVRRSLEGEFDVVAEASDGPEAVRLALELYPDVCLLDVHMPGGGGIPAAAEIVRALPDTRVVMLSVSSADEDLFEALRAGASGYLLKETDPERLPLALRGALSGEAALPRTLTARLIEEFRGRERGRRTLSVGGMSVELSDREWDVLDLMREGHSTRAIGERLAISPVTVRRHLQAILQKLRVPSRREALALLAS